MKEIAKYFCLSCEYEWHGENGPTTCPHCGHLYVKWVNFRGQSPEGREVKN